MNDPFDVSVAERMVSPVHSIQEQDRLEEARRRMALHGVSALPVADDTGRVGGVISLSDLLRVGRMRPIANGRRHALELPDARVHEHMSTPVEVVPPQSTLRHAAKRMVRRHLHRLYVARDRTMLGVLTTRELMEAVADARVETPLSHLATAKVVAVRTSDPVSLAVDRLVASHHRALVVTDGGWPVGVFTQREALAARDARAGSPVELWFDPSFIAVRPETPAHRAAAQAVATGPRCLLLAETSEALGIVTGMDFARLIGKS